MASKVIFERFLWFNDQVKAKRFPNSKTLADKFELSRKTAQRDIEFIRDRLGAPLIYMANKRGYDYEDNTYDLPGIWINEEELVALLISSRLASTVPDKRLKVSLKSFLEQIISLHSIRGSISLDDLNERISVKNIEYSRIEEKTFHQVVDALFYKRPLMIGYYSPHKDEYTRRDILPLHLLQYMGTWHLIAYCAIREGLRDFALSRMRSVEPSAVRIDANVPITSIKEYIRKNFGLISSDTTIEVCLKFSPDIAPWISEQVWHPRQETVADSDGSICLKFPVADLREIKREVLKYGSQVEVLSPESLRQEVKEEIAKMKKVYR
ncbi:MAG: WYL domain-containing transcriptional regulator [Thermodesulfobacteriota bacterium]|nr:WYL domain-containing transcriptional regulator [Thermodesulfobacteriota bacterium]